MIILRINEAQANAILDLLAEADELDYIHSDGSLQLYNNITSQQDIHNLELQIKKQIS